MRRIDRLIIKAKRSIGTELVLAMIDLVPDGCRAILQLDHKAHGKPLEICESLHPTMDAALDHIHTVADKYPNSRDLTILVDDMPG